MNTRAKTLRRDSTDAERRLWRVLRAKRFHGLKFRRQEPMGRYYADFVCYARRVVIELDGGQHAENPYDVRRDAWFEAEGYRVIRIWNTDVLRNLDGVLRFLETELGVD